MEPHPQKTLEEASTELLCYLRRQLSYTGACINKYKVGIRKIGIFMELRNYLHYTSEVCEDYISTIIGKRTYKKLSLQDKHSIRCANVLLEYQTTKTISLCSMKKKYKFNGRVGKNIQKYINYRRAEGLLEKTLNTDKLYLSRFQSYLGAHNIQRLSDVTQQEVLGFIGSLCYHGKATIHCTVLCLKRFLQYLYENQELDVNWTYILPKVDYKNESKLPSTYTEEEVEGLIHAIDRGNPRGKRDYAMILLAARLGMRRSDICDLMFKNIFGQKNSIVLKQKKTQKMSEFPLTEEIGNAIIDYMKHGRPQVMLPHIFIRFLQPYQRLNEGTMHRIVSSYLCRAGIPCLNRRQHGPHALRHSLVARLLEKKTPLPVISEVLGHHSIESTKAYIRIDTTSLRQYALEVPRINNSFYIKEEVK